MSTDTAAMKEEEVFPARYDTVIAPALARFMSDREVHDIVPLSHFYPDHVGPAAELAMLVKIEGTRTDVRYVHIGARLISLLGNDHTGKLMSAVMPKAVAADAMSSYRRAALMKEPVLEKRHLLFKGFIPITYQRAMFPLSENGRKVTHVLVYFVPEHWWAKHRYQLREPAVSDAGVAGREQY